MRSSIVRNDISSGKTTRQQRGESVPKRHAQGLQTSTYSTQSGNASSRNVVTPAAAVSASASSFGRGNAPSNKHKTTTTEALYSTGTGNRTMTVDKQIVDELLLVCGVIGTTTKVPSNTGNGGGGDHDDNSFTIVPVTDCVQWLQDLQRCLRRDDDVTRPISLLLHSWNIVVQKLLPLVYNTQYDTTLIITICKIIVLLTKPLHVQTINAGRMMIHTKSSTSNNITEE
jgi:Timeless protein